MFPWIARNVVYRGLMLTRGEPVLRRLGELRESERLGRDRLDDLTWRQAGEQIRYASGSVPFYKSTFRDHLAALDRMIASRDLTGLPTLEKGTIRENYQKLLAAGSHRSWEESTSGSTGTPFKFRVDAPMLSSFRAAKYRGHAWHGVPVGAKEGRFYGIPMNLGGYGRERLKDALMNRYRHSVFDMSDEALGKTLRRFESFRPAYLYGYASALYRLACYLLEREKSIAVRLVVSTSEVLLPGHRRAMERAFGCAIANEYGASETGILGFDCPEGTMHVPAENVLVEILNEGGKPARPGETGEVVVTELHNRVMPLIRYRIGDLARWGTASCMCGRSLPTLDIVEGRTNDMVRTPGGRIANGLIFYYVSRQLLESRGGVRQFIVRQRSLDTVVFQIVKDDTFTTDSLKMLEEKTREYLGDEMKAEFEFVEEIPRHPAGKLMHFMSELPAEKPGGAPGRAMDPPR